MDNDGRKDKAYLVFALLSLFILLIIGVLNYGYERDPITDTFVNSYYRGHNVDISDTKTLYAALNAYGSATSTSCIIQPSVLSQTERVLPCNQTLPWIQDSSAITEEEATKYAEMKATITPYSDGDYIIAPGELKFSNSNVSSLSSNIVIEATIGTDYKVQWAYVGEWWCHMDADGDYSHTDVIGYGSSNNTTSVKNGTIIGRATAATAVTIWKRSSEGSGWEICSFSDYYSR